MHCIITATRRYAGNLEKTMNSKDFRAHSAMLATIRNREPIRVAFLDSRNAFTVSSERAQALRVVANARHALKLQA